MMPLQYTADHCNEGYRCFEHEVKLYKVNQRT